jgi:hypothetical protein
MLQSHPNTKGSSPLSPAPPSTNTPWVLSIFYQPGWVNPPHQCSPAYTPVCCAVETGGFIFLTKPIWIVEPTHPLRLDNTKKSLCRQERGKGDLSIQAPRRHASGRKKKKTEASERDHRSIFETPPKTRRAAAMAGGDEWVDVQKSTFTRVRTETPLRRYPCFCSLCVSVDLDVVGEHVPLAQAHAD